MAKRDGATAYAEDRPRIHIWPTEHPNRHAYSFGATGGHFLAGGEHTIGHAIDQALARVDASKGVVVIIEPRLG